MSRLLALILAVLATTLVPVGAPAVADGPRASHPATSAKRGGPVLTVRSTRYGKILTDGKGRVLYLFTRDGRGKSRCYDACAAAWPVLFAKGTPRAGNGARQSLIGTVRRNGGGTQVTYAGQPLYYYVGDVASGQVTCHDVYEFGGTWLALRGGGRAVGSGSGG